MKRTRFCPAKVNLFLEVTGKRPNGYHELSTLFAKITLGDWLTVEALPAPKTSIALQITGPQGKHIPANPRNLVWKAAQAFLDRFGLHTRLRVLLEKHVPTGAGLGGGSSDAAGILLTLCEMFHKKPQELLDLAAQLGADVPLFMYPEPFLKGEGIGEKLTPIAVEGSLPHLVLVYPNIAVSTKEVFARLQLPHEKEVLTNKAKLDKLIDVVRHGMPLTEWMPLFFNRLEEAVVSFVGPVNQALKDISQASGTIGRMSGSGSTVFALVGTEQDAKETAQRLKSTGMLVYPVSFYPGAADANYRNQNSSDE